MDKKFENLYREVFADLQVDSEESQELVKAFEEANPPPDKLVWLRATAFRIGCEYLTDDQDSNVALLRAINAIVHALEKTTMEPSVEDTSSFDEDRVTEYYQEIFSDLSIDREENEKLFRFFSEENVPPTDKLIWVRASAFRVGTEYLTDSKEDNVSLLRCINVVVHAFEKCCLKPKPYVLRMEVPPTMVVESIGLDASIEKAVQHMWDLDVNRLTPGKDYVINVQKGKKPYQKYDAAPEPLFSSVDPSACQRPTYKTFVALLDNYSPETGTAEKVSDAERREVWQFLRAIMQTAPMQFCHKYCRANDNHIPADREGFMKLLHKIWFDLYGRSGRADSSGFEHVFVGEEKDGKVSGFHNWIQFYLEEKHGRVDYRGYIKPRSKNDAETDGNDHVLTLQFKWNGVEKFVGTSFIGVSPEFEMAVYTTCFLVGKENNKLELNTGTDIFDLNIKCFKIAHGKIGTSFPEALAHEEA